MPSSSRSIPNNWPSDVIYLSKPQYSPGVSSSLLIRSEKIPVAPTRSGAPAALCSGSETLSGDEVPTIPTSCATSPSPLVRICPIKDTAHPACNQHGLFATRNLPSDSFILCYLGWTHTGLEADPESNYDLSLDRELDVAVDATSMGNEARFINDYRGVRPDGPNAEFRDILIRIDKGQIERRVGVFVKPTSKNSGKGKKGQDLGIKKGEEIVVSYGKGFWKARSGR